MKLRFTIQISFLILFFYLLLQTTFPLAQNIIPVDLFLRLDPLVSSLIPVAGKFFILNLIPGLCILLLTLCFGRFFCGFICPMGTSLDLTRKIITSKNNNNNIKLEPKSRQIKYIFLIIITTAAFFGINHIFWGSPIALITRFYALIIHPILQLLASIGLTAFRPVLESQGILNLAYAQIAPKVFHTVYFIAIFFAIIFALEKIRPRFWCRYLCPAGAILALLSWRNFLRRKVDNCISCGKCVKSCPTEAISPDGKSTLHSECITCRNCVEVCPVKAVSFSIKHKAQNKNNISGINNNLKAEKILTIPSRRTFIHATLTGTGLATLAYINGASLIPKTAKASLVQMNFIRPPGAIPEADFLATCIRCGQCMKACPSNGLQPSWSIAGFEGVFSPVLMSRIGPCEPECNICGLVCPTEAILPLPLEDKRQAKIGTAVVDEKHCLAFANERSCVVCQEVCPFGAVEIKTIGQNKIPVPIVSENRCFGCGYCERHCPVHIPAITIQPLNILRLPTNNYAEEAKRAGFDIRPVSMRINDEMPDFIAPDELPPGFTE